MEKRKFIVEDGFWALFPDAKIGIVLCHGVDNRIKGEGDYNQLLSAAEAKAKTYLTEEEFSRNPVIQVWRCAFQRFKTKKGARSSIEALLKRVDNGSHLGSINPLVDIYNALSLSYALPCGGEDLDKFAGNVRLTKAEGNEAFVTLGSEESSMPYEGEIIYKDDEGAICRCLNWRESVRTMLTESTVNAFMCMECIDPERHDVLDQALRELAETIKVNLGGETSIYTVSMQNREVPV